MKVEKRTHIWPGSFIKIILSPYGLRADESNMWNLYPGSVHEIVDRPTRKSRRNGDMGVWVDGVREPAFVRFFCWNPFIKKAPMKRKAIPMTRNEPVMKRTVEPIMRRTVEPPMRRRK